VAAPLGLDPRRGRPTLLDAFVNAEAPSCLEPSRCLVVSSQGHRQHLWVDANDVLLAGAQVVALCGCGTLGQYSDATSRIDDHDGGAELSNKKGMSGFPTRVEEIRVGRWSSLGVSVLLLILSYVAVVELTAWVR
jgi:hypothetical protein